MTGPVASPVAPNPGTGLGIAGLIVDFFIAPLGLILSIVGKVQSRRAGVPNAVATAGIVLGIVFTLGVVTLAVVLGSVLGGAAAECGKLGNGTHVVGNSTYTCAPGSFTVSTGSGN
jgi:hypothetical protein